MYDMFEIMVDLQIVAEDPGPATLLAVRLDHRYQIGLRCVMM
jgi:hypothetical protein